MPISAKWKHKSSIHIGFIVFNGGVTTFFAKSVLQHNPAEACHMANIDLQIMKINIFIRYIVTGNKKMLAKAHGHVMLKGFLR